MKRIRQLLLLLCAPLSAAPAGELLVHEGFDECGHLETVSGKAVGFDGPWIANQDPLGYNVITRKPMSYPGLAGSASYAFGTAKDLTRIQGAIRYLDVDGALKTYAKNGRLCTGGELWISYLVRRDYDSGRCMIAFMEHEKGSPSTWHRLDEEGKRFEVARHRLRENNVWSLAAGRAEVATTVPFVDDQVTLIVLCVTLGKTAQVTLYINPPLDSQPQAADAQLDFPEGLAFNAVYWRNEFPDPVMSFDEFRMGTSFAAVTPAGQTSLSESLTAEATPRRGYRRIFLTSGYGRTGGLNMRHHPAAVVTPLPAFAHAAGYPDDIEIWKLQRLHGLLHGAYYDPGLTRIEGYLDVLGNWDQLLYTVSGETSTIRSECEALQIFYDRLLKTNPEGKCYIYGQFEYAATSFSREANIQRTKNFHLPRSAEAFRVMTEQNPGKTVRFIPVGRAYLDLLEAIEAGQVPGLTNWLSLYRNGIETNPTLIYFVQCVSFGALYEQSPIDAAPGARPDAVTPAMAAVLERIAWNAVRKYGGKPEDLK